VLYQPLNLSELRRAAAQNDINTVVRILDVHSSSLDDPRSLIIAAKAGHPDVINMLFGYGEFNPDPDPLDNQPPDSATPILAAIGRENLEVIKLFLNQPNFDPTRRIKGETYFEIAKRRGGSVWKEEEALLKDAFEKHKKSHKSSPGKPRSPGLRRDGRDTDSKRPPRRDEPQLSRSHKRRTSSPKLKDSETNKSVSRGQSKEGRQSKEGQPSGKRGPGRPRKDESAAANSDREISPLGPPKQKSQKRSESELVASESETAVKPRRKLVSGKEFRVDRDLGKPRRSSVTSITSSASTKDRREGESKPDRATRKTSPTVSRTSKTSSPREKDLPSEKSSLDREKSRSLKRDDSKDRLSAIRGESPAKRPRKSATPPRSGMQEVTTNYDATGGPQKRRKIEGDSRPGTKAENQTGPSSDHRTPSYSKIAPNDKTANLDPEANTKEKPARTQKRVDSPERPRHSRQEEEKRQERVAKEAAKEAATADSAASALRIEEERESRKRREKEQIESQARREKEELEAKEKAEMELALQVRLAKEELARVEETRRQQEENERKERQRQEDAEAHSREQERQKKLYLEQEKQKREDQERRRAQIQEQQRAERIRVEKEKRMERLGKLPLLLRWLDMSNDPRTSATASLFRFIEGFRYDTINPEASGHPNGRELWMLNTHVALLLGEKDLQLSRCKYLMSK